MAGKGVFARKHIPKGTHIGAYPGRPRSVPQILAKAETAPAAKGFVFHTSTGGLGWLWTTRLLLGQEGVVSSVAHTLAMHCRASVQISLLRDHLLTVFESSCEEHMQCQGPTACSFDCCASQWQACSLPKPTCAGLISASSSTWERLRTSQQRSERTLRPPAGQLLDPTDSTGCPSERPQPGMPWLWSVDHTLAFVNEPPPGRSTNVEVGRGNSKLDLPFIATRVSSCCGPGRQRSPRSRHAQVLLRKCTAAPCSPLQGRAGRALCCHMSEWMLRVQQALPCMHRLHRAALSNSSLLLYFTAVLGQWTEAVAHSACCCHAHSAGRGS